MSSDSRHCKRSCKPKKKSCCNTVVVGTLTSNGTEPTTTVGCPTLLPVLFTSAATIPASSSLLTQVAFLGPAFAGFQVGARVKSVTTLPTTLDRVIPHAPEPFTVGASCLCRQTAVRPSRVVPLTAGSSTSVSLPAGSARITGPGTPKELCSIVVRRHGTSAAAASSSASNSACSVAAIAASSRVATATATATLTGVSVSAAPIIVVVVVVVVAAWPPRRAAAPVAIAVASDGCGRGPGGSGV